MKLSSRTKDIVKILFSDGDVKEVEKLLEDQYSNNVPGCGEWSQEELERVWLSVLKISGGGREKLHDAIVLANKDYRDLFISAGFGHEAEAHKHWRPRVKKPLTRPG